MACRRPVRCDRCAVHCSRQPVAQFGRRCGSLITCRLYDVRRFYRKNVLHDAPVSPNKTDRRRPSPHYAARCDMALGRDALWDNDDVARWKTSCRPRPRRRRDDMPLPRWQLDSRRIYVRPRTGPQSTRLWLPAVAKLQAAGVPIA